MTGLQGIRLKRKRGWDELNALDADISRFLQNEEPRPYDVSIDFAKDSSILTIAVKIQTPPDPMWGIRIGEILHNFRSALDHLAFELFGVGNRGRRPGKHDKVQFPIFQHRSGFDRRTHQYLKDFRFDVIDAVIAEQPFPIVDGGTGEGAESPLSHLKELNEWDKHRTLHLTATLLEQFHFTFPPAKMDGTVFKEIRNAGPIHDEAVLVRALFPGINAWPFTKRDVDCKLLVHMAFDEGTPSVGGWLVVGTLTDIANRTDRILSRFITKFFETEL